MIYDVCCCCCSCTAAACAIRFSYCLSAWSLLSCMIVQVPRRKESIPSCALPSQNVRLLGPLVRHRRHSAVVHYEVRLALLGMQHGRMVMQDHLFPLRFAVVCVCNKGVVFDFWMSQYRKRTAVCNQPQFGLLSPLYSNPLV
jgi:hypothetical protein